MQFISAERKMTLFTYQESAYLGTIKAYNAMSWQGGAAIFLYALTLPLTYSVSS